MTKELSIKTIKEELMDALLGDMRIINSFSNKDKRKASDYIGTNIFGHLNESIRSYHVDTYINFDVAKREDKFDVYICIKTHKDLLSKSNGNNCLDNISKYIEEIINELYPDRKVLDDYIVTIDGYGAVEIDDGLSARVLPNGNYLLGVHIASVLAYLPFESEVVQEAIPFETVTKEYAQDILRIIFKNENKVVSIIEPNK